MKLDVSDLFDHLYDVVSFARARFDLSRSNDAGEDCPEWNEFCNSLSDGLFLPACAKRAFDLTHMQMSAVDVKPRIIAERSPQDGTKIVYCRYRGPYFVEGPRFFATHGIDEPGFIFRRPRHNLTLWLSELPPSERAVTPPGYPADLRAPIRYFARQTWGFCSRSPQTSYYEFHVDWCLREVHQCDASLRRRRRGGQWLHIDDLTEIPQHVFDTMWAAAVD
jgi:hypothetical protein